MSSVRGRVVVAVSTELLALDIVSLVLLIVQSGTLQTFREKRAGLIKFTTEYQHMEPYIKDEETITSFTAINTLLMMLSFTKYLASWSFTLKIYSQVMSTFV